MLLGPRAALGPERWREEEEQWRGQDTGGRRREQDSLTDRVERSGEKKKKRENYKSISLMKKSSVKYQQTKFNNM